MTINILDSSVYNRISAGEVVERPASVVKELIENSLDADANDIEIEIKNGGISYISVSDNGKGISPDEIKKVFLPHATSKVKNIDDLDAIKSLGFRGEAMASIASVARVSMFSKTYDKDVGAHISVAGGVFDDVKPFSMNKNGTITVVENLFFNTPVRAKFLKKPKSEETEITQLVERFIMANPDKNFKYIIDEKLIYHHHTGTLIDAITSIYGKDFSKELTPVLLEKDNFKVAGFVSQIGFSKPNTSYQTTVINGRYIVDQLISKAVYAALEEYLMTRQFPVFVLHISMPFSLVDINIHPTKLNVKFQDPNTVYNLIFKAVRAAIFGSLQNTKYSNSALNINFDSKLPDFVTTKNDIEIQNINGKQSLINADEGKSYNADEQDKKQEVIITHETPIKFDTEIKFETKQTENFIQAELMQSEKRIISDNYKLIGEIFNTYLLVEQGDNIVVFDIHACHERLNYDRFMNQLDNKGLTVQQLLLPYVFSVNTQEMDFILSIKQLLIDYGFEFEQFGKNELKLSSVPVLFKDLNLKSFVNDLLNDIKHFSFKMPYEIRNYVAQKACKSSVRAGQSLNENEIESLLSTINNSKTVMLCPHGRPVSFLINRSMFEKWFKRIV